MRGAGPSPGGRVRRDRRAAGTAAIVDASSRRGPSRAATAAPVQRSMRVHTAVLPAAGWGTRFLPATKAQPKEMMPLVDKPVIQYAVEEAVAAGIEHIVIVTNSQNARRLGPA